jgi:hypothetical protein
MVRLRGVGTPQPFELVPTATAVTGVINSRAKYGAADVKKYFVKFDVAVAMRLPSPPAPTRVDSSRTPSPARRSPGKSGES